MFAFIYFINIFSFIHFFFFFNSFFYRGVHCISQVQPQLWILSFKTIKRLKEKLSTSIHLLHLLPLFIQTYLPKLILLVELHPNSSPLAPPPTTFVRRATYLVTFALFLIPKLLLTVSHARSTPRHHLSVTFFPHSQVNAPTTTATCIT